MRLGISIITFFAAILFCVTSALPFHSAKCLALGEQCGPVVSENSEYCNSFTAPADQPQRCFDEACSFCMENPRRRSRFPCRSPAVRSRCSVIIPPSPIETSPPTNMDASRPAEGRQRGPGVCTYSGENKVVVDLGNVRPSDGWTRMRREGMRGIIFEQGRRTRNIIAAGTKGVMCFNVRMAEGGQYYTTAITSSPDNTEHNDVWIRSSKGFRLFRNGQFRRSRRTGWLKGFQNLGRNRIANTLKNTDHNGHYLVTNVNGGERVEICISGRSSLFEMFKIALVRCFGDSCGPRDVAGQLADLRESRCA